MKFTGHWLRYSSTQNVVTLFIKSLQATKFAFILFAANLTSSLLIFYSDHRKVFMPIYQSLHLATWQFHQQECADMANKFLKGYQADPIWQHTGIKTLKTTTKLGVILLTESQQWFWSQSLWYWEDKICFNHFCVFVTFQYRGLNHLELYCILTI